MINCLPMHASITESSCLAMMRVRECDVQNALYRHLRARGAWPIFPNMDCITGYEADLLVITKAGYAHEYEIKLTLADFRADLKKLYKHASLSGNVREVPNPYSWEKQKTFHVLSNAVSSPHDYRDRCYPESRPKNFWYVINGFDVPEEEIPSYAGLMRYVENGPFETLKQAPTLDAKPADPKRIEHAKTNMLFRYWNMRLERVGKAGDRV